MPCPDWLDIKGIDRARLLIELHRGTRAVGFGVFHDKGLTPEQAAEVIKTCTSPSGKVEFDYVAGRPIKVDFVGDELVGGRLYDRDAGEGACEAAVARARAK